MSYSEANYERAILDVLENELGYLHVSGSSVSRDYTDVLYLDELIPSLLRINKDLPKVAIDEAILKIRNIDTGSLIQMNKIFTDYMQHGVTVNYFNGKEQRSTIVKLIDFDNIHQNSFYVIDQWTIIENSTKRPDIIIFVNGLPLVVFELKSPSREETDSSAAYRQLRNYMHEIPTLFNYNAFCVMSDLALSKAGTITSSEDRFMEWKSTDGSYENTQHAQFDTFLVGMFEKSRFLDILKNFILFSADNKILAGYHQYFAVRKAISSTVDATVGDGRAGVFWHTQGSGKSLSMVFYAQLLQHAINAPTIVVITDRNDLDNQLYEQFSKCASFLRQQPIQAENRNHLQKLLAGREAYGIIFSTMQKFEETSEALSDRHNIVVVADEAHRSQYGLEEKVVPESGRVIIGNARIIRDSLPNASYIGFTGTPISAKDRSTVEVFGSYIDIYDMTQSVEDGATRPVYYESRVIHLKLDDEILKDIDEEYLVLSEQTTPYVIEKSKQELSRMESLLGADQTIDALCTDILEHYEENRQYEQTGKALIVAYSRAIAMKIYRRLLEMRPHWTEKVGVVMTSGNNDPEEWREVIGNKRHKEDLAIKFKDDSSPFKIAIVVDMWLTGFDVPSLSTMYIYKPMSGHNLMQAIARVNRVYLDKEGGLVVDYVGIASSLKEAMNDYTNRDRRNYGEQDVAKTALPKFQEKLEICQDIFYGYDYSKFLDHESSDADRARAIAGGVNFLSAPAKEDSKEDFIKEGLMLRQALSLCRSLVGEEERFEAAFFDAVRTVLVRLSSTGKTISLKEINGRINELLKATIKTDGVINLFNDVDEGVNILDPSFLDGINQMKERNLAVELLKKLLSEQVSVYTKTNLVKSELFSERLTKAMNAYYNGQISNNEVVEELLKMAKDMTIAHQEGQDLGLSVEELAFYDALTKPEAVKDFYDNEELKEMARELTEQLRKSRTIDWDKKTTARAKMRRMIRKLLRKYKYPPEGIDYAMATVIAQCEQWVDNTSYIA